MHQVYHGKRTFTKVEIAVFQSKDEIGPLLIERICYFPPFFFLFFFFLRDYICICMYTRAFKHIQIYRHTHRLSLESRSVYEKVVTI